MNKFFQPSRYRKWLLDKWVKGLIFFQIPFHLTAKAMGETVIFRITTYKEFVYRYLNSYTAEVSTMYWIENCIQPGDTVWDIGANVGAYSLLIAKRFSKSKEKNGVIFAFEPESSNFHALNRNVQINSLDEWIKTVPLAFGAKRQFGVLYLSSNEAGSAAHGLHRPESDGNPFQPTHRQGILVLTVDDFLSWDSSGFPNHIKIDVDGLETEIVGGMTMILSDNRLKTIVIEVAVALSQGAIEGKIISAGFQIIFEESWSSASGLIKNYVFKRMS